MDANNNPRYQMWCRMIPGYSKMSKEDRFAIKKQQYGIDFHLVTPTEQDEQLADLFNDAYVAEATQDIPAMQVPATGTVYSLLQTFPNYWKTSALSLDCSTTIGYYNNKTPEKETTMYDMAKSDAMIQRNYLKERLYDASSKKSDAAQRAHGLLDDRRPNSPQEIVDRIAAGKFVLPEKKDRQIGYYNSFDNIIWRDPALKADHAGYDAWEAKDQESFTSTKDTIMVAELADGLKALQAYETAPVA